MPAETAVFIGSDAPGAPSVEEIDGTPAQRGFAHMYEVPPGPHTVMVRLNAANVGPARLVARAGHGYQLRVEKDYAAHTWGGWFDDVGVSAHREIDSIRDDLEGSCRHADWHACIVLADALHQGFTSRGWDEHHAEQLYRAACISGYAPGCTGLGDMYERGHFGPRDPFRAAQTYEGACARDPNACNRLGMLHQQGVGFVKDPSAAEPWYRKSCDGGYATGCYHLAQLYLVSGSADGHRAPALLEKACGGGEAAACSQLARLHQADLVPGHSRQAAMALFDRACAAGDPGGCNGLGELYEQGGVVERDERRAARLYEWACAADDPAGCANFGVVLALGLGIQRDDRKALSSLRTACWGGVRSACDGASILRLETERAELTRSNAARKSAPQAGRQ